MEKNAKILLILALVALFVAVVLLYGCVSTGNEGSPQQSNAGQQGASAPGEDFGGGAPPEGTPYGPNFTGMRGGNRTGSGRNSANLTDEQRQQMREQRIAEANAACSGLEAGSACAMQGGPGGNITGTCQEQNGTLACAFSMNRGGQGGQ